MKQLSYFILALFLTVQSGITNAQTIATFESNTIPASGYWNGSDGSGGFTSGNAKFNNKYDTAFGGNWGGWSLSNKTDSMNGGFSNQYSAANGVGAMSSANYAVAYYDTYGAKPSVVLTGSGAGKMALGCYINNTAYAYSDMKKGSAFSKKFGGLTGNDSDYFKLIATGYKGGKATANKAELMLADYRSADSTKDYILKRWTWMDLTALGNIDSLVFSLASNDTGMFGMNTPAYFCMDNFTTADQALSLTTMQIAAFNIYPNPASSMIYTSLFGENTYITITDMNGATVMNNSVCRSNAIDISNLNTGIYIITISTTEGLYTQKFVKN